MHRQTGQPQQGRHARACRPPAATHLLPSALWVVVVRRDIVDTEECWASGVSKILSSRVPDPTRIPAAPASASPLACAGPAASARAGALTPAPTANGTPVNGDG